MRHVRQIAAIIIGLVFFASGLVKLIDPVGSTLIVKAYLDFLHLGFLSPTAGAAGVAIPLLEVLTGSALLCGFKTEAVRYVAGILLAFFTLTTVILVIFRPQMDCGCFGEAIHLTHTESLAKNIVLSGLWALAFIPLKKTEENRPRAAIPFAVTAATAILLGIYSLVALPLIDFTPLRPGAELQRPVEEDLDEGIEEDLAAASQPLPFFDVNWEYRDTMALGQKVMIVSSYRPEKIGRSKWNSISRLCSAAMEKGFTPIILISADPDEAAGIVPDQTLLEFTFFADTRLLQTLNRSNGGACYVSDGQIIRKWASLALPRADELSSLDKESPSETLIKTDARGRFTFQGIAIGLLAFLFLV